MGWKCPDCKHHNYKAGKCAGCNPDYCVVCDTTTGVHKIDAHHVSYKADVTIPVCKTCHEKIHEQDGFHDELEPELSRYEAEQQGLIVA